MRVVVYSGPGCQQCIATKRALDAAGAAYEVTDIVSDTAAAERLREAGMRTLPVVEVDGQIAWSGFRPEMIDGLIRRLAAA